MYFTTSKSDYITGFGLDTTKDDQRNREREWRNRWNGRKKPPPKPRKRSKSYKEICIDNLENNAA